MRFDQKPKIRESAAWWQVAGWVLFIYGSIPLARTVQEAIRDVGGKDLFLWVTLAMFAGVAAWLVRLFVSREWKCSPRQSLILGVILGVFVSWTWSLRANPEEAFHFVQYGVLAVLIFRALSHRLEDASIYFAGAMIGILLGVLDEFIQWLTPRRFFDYRDIFINAAAGLLVQLAIGAGLRPSYITARVVSPSGIRVGCRAAIPSLLILLFCVSNTPRFKDGYARWLPVANRVDELTAEYGYLIRMDGGLSFKSRLSAGALLSADRESGAEAGRLISRYRTDDEVTQLVRSVRGYENPLAVEARIHVFRRDRYAAAAREESDSRRRRQNATIADRENRILMAYFSNTVSSSVFLWTPERSQRMAGWADPSQVYQSAVSQNLLTTVSQRQITLILVVVLLACALGERWANRRITRT